MYLCGDFCFFSNYKKIGFKPILLLDDIFDKLDDNRVAQLVKLVGVVDGRTLERRFDIGEKLEDVRVEHRQYQYLYKEGEDYIFMNQEDYEQIPLMKDLITGVDFLKESDVCDVVFDTSTDTVLFAELPVKTVLEVTYTEPGEKGNTATNAMKDATVETGATVRVPLFINTGDKIRVDTRTGEYAERVRE